MKPKKYVLKHYPEAREVYIGFPNGIIIKHCFILIKAKCGDLELQLGSGDTESKAWKIAKKAIKTMRSD